MRNLSAQYTHVRFEWLDAGRFCSQTLHRLGSFADIPAYAIPIPCAYNYEKDRWEYGRTLPSDDELLDAAQERDNEHARI